MFLKFFNLLKGFFFFTGSYSNNVFPPPLTPQEEAICVTKMMNGDMDARNKLIEHNLRLVAHIVKKYESENISSDDLISIGTIGLIKGIDSFKPDKNIKITTYIAKCSENEILMFFRANKKFNGDISLNDNVGVDKDGNEISLIDVVQSNDEDIVTTILKNNDLELLSQYFSSLSKRERDIIQKRYGLNDSDEFTQKEIAKELKISRSYVSRLEKRALAKLYKMFYQKK